MSTQVVREKDIAREWFLVDASGQTLGRLASQIARILMGKHKPVYSPNIDVGDYVVVINAAQVRVTGKKLTDKIYYRHSGYPGGLKATALRDLLAGHPTRVVELAVKGMLPKNQLGRRMMGKLKVYAGGEHLHQAQALKELKLL